MSPSRIPRPGGLPPSPLGPGRSKTNEATSRASPQKVAITTEPSQQPQGGIAKPKVPSRLPQACSPNIPKTPRTVSGKSTSSPSSLSVPSSRRRPRPPSDDDLPPPRRQASAPTPQSLKRRPVPQISSDKETGVPLLGGPRKFLRQPASSANLAAGILGNIPRPVGRNRAKSAAASTVQPKSALAPNPALPIRSSSEQSDKTGVIPKIKSYLFESSFLDSREPTVPPHIASRLRLIHQLGVVLGVDAKVLEGCIDVPGLLSRVDVAYEKGFGMYTGGEEGTVLGRRGSNASTSGLPMPTSGMTSSSSQGRISVDTKAGRPSVDGRPRDGSADGGGKRKFGMWRRFSKNRRVSGEEAAAILKPVTNDDGPVFGVTLADTPNGSWCTSLIGGQRHDLPMIVFTVVEEIYRRGMSQPGIFRLAGDGARLSQLIDTFNLSPLYGDTLPLDSEPVHNLTGLIKRYVRELPEPILDEAILPALISFCASDTPSIGQNDPPAPFSEETRIMAAHILLKLLPPPHFSLLMYLLAFLGQLPLFPDNRLNIDSISIIFGPAICAPRGKGISGLGPSPVGRGSDGSEAERISSLVDDSQAVLGWLLRNWPSISEKVLEPSKDSVDQFFMGPSEESTYDPRLLSPIDLRGQSPEDSPYATGRAMSARLAATHSAPVTSPSAPSSESMLATPPHRWSSVGAVSPPSPQVVSNERQFSRPRSATSASSSPSFGLGLFHRAKSSSNLLQSSHRGSLIDTGSGSMLDNAGPKAKRSASLTSLSSLLKMGGKSSPSPSQGRSRSNPNTCPPKPLTSPQVHSVLDSLHDLLISKDKQIERDARELALLRHTLLEMDEKLQRLSTSPETGGGGSYLSSMRGPPSAAMLSHSSGESHPSTYSRCSSTPSILVTSSTSSHQVASSSVPLDIVTINAEKQLQDRLDLALAELEAARNQSRDWQRRMCDLESRLALSEAERKAEINRVEVQLTIEHTRVRSLIEERDLARDRLDKVKSTLFGDRTDT